MINNATFEILGSPTLIKSETSVQSKTQALPSSVDSPQGTNPKSLIVQKAMNPILKKKSQIFKAFQESGDIKDDKNVTPLNESVESLPDVDKIIKSKDNSHNSLSETNKGSEKESDYEVTLTSVDEETWITDDVQVSEIVPDETVADDSITKLPPARDASSFATYSQMYAKVTPPNVPSGRWRYSREDVKEPFIPRVVVKVSDTVIESLNLEKETVAFPEYVTPKEEEEAAAAAAAAAAPSPAPPAPLLVPKPEFPPPAPLSKEVRYTCPDCRTFCTSLREVKEHDCEPKFECEDCKPIVNKYKKKKTLILHLEHSHPGKVVQCPCCPRKTTSKTLLKDHVMADHPEHLETIFGKQTVPKTGSRKYRMMLEKWKKKRDLVTKKEEPSTYDEEPTPLTPEPEVTRDLSSSEEMSGNRDTSESHQNSSSVSEGVVNTGIVKGDSSQLPSTLNVTSDAPPQSADSSESVPSTPGTPVSRPVIEPAAAVTVEEETETKVKKLQYSCKRCGKEFNTNIRFRNHLEHCGVDKDTLERRRREAAAKRRALSPPEVEPLRFNWSHLPLDKERCNKCGRSDYKRSLAEHKAVCRGQHSLASVHKCQFCRPVIKFPTTASLKLHLMAMHADEKWLGKPRPANKRAGALAHQHFMK